MKEVNKTLNKNIKRSWFSMEREEKPAQRNKSRFHFAQVIVVVLHQWLLIMLSWLEAAIWRLGATCGIPTGFSLVFSSSIHLLTISCAFACVCGLFNRKRRTSVKPFEMRESVPQQTAKYGHNRHWANVLLKSHLAMFKTHSYVSFSWCNGTYPSLTWT